MKKLHFFDKVLFFINSLVAILLLASYALPHLDPEKYSHLAVLSLAYPAILTINILFIIIWIVKLKPQFLLSLISILVGLNYIHNFYSIEDKEVIKDSDIKILSFNVRRFNANNWIKSPDVKQNICDFINKQNPDIACFQEHSNDKNVKLNVPLVYKHNGAGLAIYSKFPIVGKGKYLFKGHGNNIAYVDLKINQKLVRIYNVHLQSFRLNERKELDGNKSKEALYQRFKSVFKEQAHQIKKLKENINQCPHQTIVMGDFNNTAFSWVYHQVIEGRKDAFVEAGINFGKSYHYFFPFRIDFILPDESIEVGKFTTYNVNLSDHDPIMARINLNN